MIRLAVTGATGFVGSAVVRAAIGRGWQVTAFGRRPGSRYWDLTAGPLADPPQVDAVVHCAAVVTDWGPVAPIRAATVDGTRAVAATFPRSRLVHLSSASVYDPFTPSVDITEDAGPVNRYLTAYAAAKADAERALSTRRNTVILRPHAVYGPGDPTLLPRLLSAVRGRTLLMVGDGTARASLTGIDNLVDAVLLACEPDAPVGVYNIADAAPVTIGETLRAVLAARGLPVRIRQLPVGVARPLASVAETAYRLLGRPEAPRLTRYAISHLAVERTLNIDLAQCDLGYRPRPTELSGAAYW